MKILICNERFLFRFGMDRVLLLLGSYWKQAGAEVIFMGNKLDEKAAEKCSDRFISLPTAEDPMAANSFTKEYLMSHWHLWFDEKDHPDIALIAGWPFYECASFLKVKCGQVLFHDYGGVPTEGMSPLQARMQKKLVELRQANFPKADRIIAISSFLEETQSKRDNGGIVPTSYVHLGLDHLDKKIWDREELGADAKVSAGEEILERIRRYKGEGYRIIFQPGRYEKSNYKNSAATMQLVERLQEKGHKVKLLVLANREGMDDIPPHLEDAYECLGFIDDATMRSAMELSELGVSPTLWEGFDLPLGEMQYLNRCMYVFNIGAHPEVAADPYFLCSDMEEMIRKVEDQLEGRLPFTQDALDAMFRRFRDEFNWQNMSDRLLSQMKEMVLAGTVLFVDVTNACRDKANPGVMRVTRRLSHFLQKKVTSIFVIWDKERQQYVLPYPSELQNLGAYNGPIPEEVPFRSEEGKGRTTMDRILPGCAGKRLIHFYTETVPFSTMRVATRALHEKGIYVAAIFYDAIAVLRPELVSKEVYENHREYMYELANTDLVIPIAHHNQLDLEKYWEDAGIPSTTWAKVDTVTLAAEMEKIPRNRQVLSAGNLPEKKQILFVSTLEPRKNHIRFLSAVEELLLENPSMEETIQVNIVGNKYYGNTEIPAFIEKLSKAHPCISYLGVASDSELMELYQNAYITAYPSEIEGFGMPIIESLWFGKPCLCHESGSMGELGKDGGCALTNVLDVASIKETLSKLLTDEAYYSKLQKEAVERPITSWEEYTDGILASMLSMKADLHEKELWQIPVLMQQEIQAYFTKGKQGLRGIALSNFYPPNVNGGAEVIAHHHTRTLNDGGEIRMMAFTIDIRGIYPTGTCVLEETDGVPVLRLFVENDRFYPDGNNVFHAGTEAIFETLCRIVCPDIVHCHNLTAMSLGMISIAKRWNAKVCMTLHDTWGFCYKATMIDQKGALCDHVGDCERCLSACTRGGIRLPMQVRKQYVEEQLSKVDVFLSPSEFLKANYVAAGFDASRIRVLWNGIDTERFALPKKAENIESAAQRVSKLRITYAGIFKKHKGVDVLIRAFAKLVNGEVETGTKSTEYMLNLVGDGEEKTAYEALAKELGVYEKISFWGRIANDEMQKVYEQTDIFCLPSVLPENQPVSISESLSCGIPAVASDLGGSKELITHGENGYIFPAGDVSALAECLARLSDDETRARLGAKGRRRMEQHSFVNQMKLLTEIYRELTASMTAEDAAEKETDTIYVIGSRIPGGLSVKEQRAIRFLDWEGYRFLDGAPHKGESFCILMPGEAITAKREALLHMLRVNKLYTTEEDAYEYAHRGYEVLTYKHEFDLVCQIKRGS